MYGFCSNRADLWIFEEGIPVFGNCVNGNEDLGCKKGAFPVLWSANCINSRERREAGG